MNFSFPAFQDSQYFGEKKKQEDFSSLVDVSGKDTHAIA